MMRYKLLCKVPTGQNFVLLKASATIDPSEVYYNQVTYLTITSNIESVITSVKVDPTKFEVYKNDEFHYMLKAIDNPESDEVVDVYVRVEDIVYKQVRDIHLTVTIKAQVTGTIPVNYYSTSEQTTTTNSTQYA